MVLLKANCCNSSSWWPQRLNNIGTSQVWCYQAAFPVFNGMPSVSEDTWSGNLCEDSSEENIEAVELIAAEEGKNSSGGGRRYSL